MKTLPAVSCRVRPAGRTLGERAAALALVVVLMLPTVPAAAQATPTAGRAETVFFFRPGVAAEDEALIRAGVRLAQDAFPTIFGATVRGPVHEGVGIVPCASGEPACPARAQTDGGGSSFNTGNSLWQAAAPLVRVKLVVHEYTHVLEHELTEGNPAGPSTWLWDGTAEYAGYRALVLRGLTTDDRVLAYNLWVEAHAAALAAATPGPPDPWSYWPYAAPYADAYLRTARLAATRGGGAALRDYFARIGQGADPVTAFAAAFGESPEAFDAEYAAWHASQVPPVEIPAAFAPLGAPQDLAAPVAIRSVAGPTAWSGQALLVAITEPEARCVLALTDAAGTAVASVPALAGEDGTVFWLWTVAEAAGATTAEVRCGGPPATAGAP